MKIREHLPVVRRGADELVVLHTRPPVVVESSSPARGRWGIPLGLGLVLLLLVAGLVGRTVDETDRTVVAGAPGAGSPSAPTSLGALSIEVDAPDTVTARRPATFTVTWQDGDGIFSGTSEDWGDGVGVSSAQQESCEGATADPRPGKGSLIIRHVWDRPGSYQVNLGVSTYTCRAGKAVVETADQLVTVEVLAAGLAGQG